MVGSSALYHKYGMGASNFTFTILHNNGIGREIYRLLSGRNAEKGHFSTENFGIVVMKALDRGFLREIVNGALVPTRK